MTEPTADPQRMSAVLGRMAELLDEYDSGDWAQAMREFARCARFAEGRVEVRGDVRRMYGGAGSLNDIVLCSEDLPRRRADNDEFNALRHELYELCSPVRLS